MEVFSLSKYKIIYDQIYGEKEKKEKKKNLSQENFRQSNAS